MAVNPTLRRLAANIARRELDPVLAGDADAAIRLFSALISQESSWNPSAGSPAGARGLTQLMPGTARGLGVTDILNPQQNLSGGARYLAQQLRTFNGDIRKALAAYNAGPGAVQKYGGIPPYAETQNYVRKILGNLGSVPVAGPGIEPRSPGYEPGADTTLPPRSGGNSSRLALLRGLLNDEEIPALLSRIRTAKTASGSRTPLAGVPADSAPPPPAGSPARVPQSPGARGGLREAFYDPLGGYDEGRQIGAIGGHSDHVHASIDNAQAMLRAIARAQNMGLAVRENPYTDPVDPVHTEGSFHYQNFPGRYNGRQLGRGIDVSGDAAKMAAFYKWLLASLR